MQLGFSRLALMTISCSYEPPAIPIWTVAVPNVGAAPPPITSRRKLSSCLTFKGCAACKSSYKGRPIMVQVAPVSRSAIVATWLIVTGTSHPLWWPFSTGLGVVCGSHWTLDALTSVSSVRALVERQVWLTSAASWIVFVLSLEIFTVFLSTVLLCTVSFFSLGPHSGGECLGGGSCPEPLTRPCPSLKVGLSQGSPWASVAPGRCHAS